jgi:hypothetical protein
MAVLRRPGRFAQKRETEGRINRSYFRSAYCSGGFALRVARAFRALLLVSGRAAAVQRSARGFAEGCLVIGAETAQIREAVAHCYRLNGGLLAQPSKFVADKLQANPPEKQVGGGGAPLAKTRL